MIQITKVSAQKYKVFVKEEDFITLIYTIKRINAEKYIVRNMYDDKVVFESLKEAKEYVRGAYTDKETNWLSFFVKHTKGKKFNSQKESNDHMSRLSKQWKQRKPIPENSSRSCSLENGCICHL